uniref:X-ray repair cross complementing 1 n=1 Tax=Myotis myotis TaxID=51298 RepID=A0A7J7SED1_MYOMY|nr:X-ray repair cross complementing 1 [Myotis myotis]
MPEIRLRHVVSCSSQDSTHCADNLLKADTYRKWRAARAGEKTISVVLQLEKEEQIHSVDIGNDGSAFVEVLVGSSAGGAGEQDYEVSRDLRWAPADPCPRCPILACRGCQTRVDMSHPDHCPLEEPGVQRRQVINSAEQGRDPVALWWHKQPEARVFSEIRSLLESKTALPSPRGSHRCPCQLRFRIVWVASVSHLICNRCFQEGMPFALLRIFLKVGTILLFSWLN